MENKILCVNFNLPGNCLAVGTETGFSIYKVVDSKFENKVNKGS